MIDLSIIIVNYNTKDLTIDAIKSVVADTSVKNKQIIVVDNASSDGSAKAIKQLKNKLKTSRIEFIKNKENIGFSRANNQGIKISKGRYILLLNSDTVVKKGSLKKLINFAEKNKKCGVAGARLLNADGSIQESCFNLPTFTRAIKQYWLHAGKPLDKFYPDSEKPVEVEAVVGAGFLITPQAHKKIGGLNEKYFFYFEDLDYCRSVQKAGFKVFYVPSAEIVHYHGASAQKLATANDQWKKLIPASKVYHGVLGHYVFNFILWSGQKIDRLVGK